MPYVGFTIVWGLCIYLDISISGLRGKYCNVVTVSLVVLPPLWAVDTPHGRTLCHISIHDGLVYPASFVTFRNALSASCMSAIMQTSMLRAVNYLKSMSKQSPWWVVVEGPLCSDHFSEGTPHVRITDMMGRWTSCGVHLVGGIDYPLRGVCRPGTPSVSPAGSHVLQFPYQIC